MSVAAAAAVEGIDAEPQRRTILLVEDDVLLRMLASDELRAAGFAVLEARDADEAMAILDSGVPLDMVLTDIRMPGSMDGLGLAGIVRRRWPELKIVVASGERPARSDLAAADEFVAKPYNPSGLVARVRQLLGGSS